MNEQGEWKPTTHGGAACENFHSRLSPPGAIPIHGYRLTDGEILPWDEPLPVELFNLPRLRQTTGLGSGASGVLMLLMLPRDNGEETHRYAVAYACGRNAQEAWQWAEAYLCPDAVEAAAVWRTLAVLVEEGE